MINQYLSMGIGMMYAIQEKNKEKLKEIQEEWVKSMEYPRKKKKKVRKVLLVEWSIFSWTENMFTF